MPAEEDTAPLWFPDPSEANDDGLLAVGGDLSVPRLLLAYQSGIFPWSIKPISWWAPDPRGIFEIEDFHVSRSLQRTLRRGIFDVTRDKDFKGVMEGCATTHKTGNWISPPFIEAYTELHEAGHAHSVECWKDGKLAGGIYGVAVNGLFAGESMFHRETDASKVALFNLVEHLRDQGFALFDIQMVTPATERLGAIEISRDEYMERLMEANQLDCEF